MDENIKIILGAIVIFIICVSIIEVYNAYYAPLDALSYEAQVGSISNQFQQILKNDKQNMGTSQETPTSTVESQLESLIDQMDALQKRGFPPQYNNFHEHFTNSVVDYLHWRSHDRFNNSYEDYDKGAKELLLAYDSFNNVSITYIFSTK
jgi:hypothetical protein